MNNNEHIKQCEAHVKNAENQLSLAREELEKARKGDGWRHDTPPFHVLVPIHPGAGRFAAYIGGGKAVYVLSDYSVGVFPVGGIERHGWKPARLGEVKVSC